MKVLVDFSCIVKSYAPRFQSLFSEEGYLHFQKALTGMIISDNKTIEAINRMFIIHPRNQSSFNKFFTRQPFDLSGLETKRLEMLQSNEGTRFKVEKKEAGALSIDSTLLTHYGNHFDLISNKKDYVEGGYKWSHDLVTLNYSNEHTDYPIYYKLWDPPNWESVGKFFKTEGIKIDQQKWDDRETQIGAFKKYMGNIYSRNWEKYPGVINIYKTKLHIALDLIDQFVKAYPDLDYPILLDSGFTSGYVCQKIVEQYKRNYIGGLSKSQSIIQAGGVKVVLDDFVTTLKKEHFDENQPTIFHKVGVDYKGKRRFFYVYHKNHRINKYKNKQRLVIAFNNEELSGTPYFVISNRTDWHPSLILRLRRQRWPIETYHQESKAEGLDKYQVRKLKGIQTHIALVVLTYSMLQCVVHDPKLLSSIQERLRMKADGTLPFLRRLMQAESMVLLVEYIFAKVKQGESLEQILQTMNQIVAYT